MDKLLPSPLERFNQQDLKQIGIDTYPLGDQFIFDIPIDLSACIIPAPVCDVGLNCNLVSSCMLCNHKCKFSICYGKHSKTLYAWSQFLSCYHRLLISLQPLFLLHFSQLAMQPSTLGVV